MLLRCLTIQILQKEILMATKKYKHYQAAKSEQCLKSDCFKKTEADALVFAKEGDTMFTVMWNGFDLNSIKVLNTRLLCEQQKFKKVWLGRFK